ncbi:MAG: hypothetical protein PSX81_05385 [bacterium]|nr:hypothetical protein [bacterium]
MKNLKGLFILFLILATATAVLVYLIPYLQKKNINIEDRKSGLEQVSKNYGTSIDSCAAIFEISPEYLKALCMLECGGRKEFAQRLEPHVYNKLKMVKFGTLENYEHVTKEMLADANDDALKNLASSWGPFQLMGYKCLLLNIKAKDIRGDNAVYYGTKWIDMTYGKYLKKEKYKDAFHIHNTGMPHPTIGGPRTYDAEYCARGLKYMAYFKEH